MKRIPVAWAVGAAAVLALYIWTFTLSPEPYDSVGAFNRQADAWVHGQLHLRNEPPPGLLALPDPWEPTQNYPYSGAPGVFDMALHDGHLYPYWGPVPTLLTFLPSHALGLGNVSEQTVTLLWCLVLAAASGLLIFEAVRRWAPEAPRWLGPAGLLVVASGGGALPLIERPADYTLALAAGAALLVGGLLALLHGLPDEAPPRPRLLALGSLLVGLAIGSRWSLAPAVLVPVAVLAWLWRREVPDRRRLAVALVGPVAACGVLLLLYNQARFGSPLETGQQITLVGYGNAHKNGIITGPSFRAISFYFLKPFDLAAFFPYLWLNVKLVGGGYNYQEPTVGLLWTLPLFLAIPFAIRLVRDAAPRFAGLIAGLTGVSLVIFGPYLLINFAARRYLADFAPPLALAAVLAGIALLAYRLPADARARGRVMVAAGLLVGLMTLVNVTLSENIALATHPGSLAKLNRTFDELPTAVAFVLDKPLLSAIADKPALPGRNDPTFPLIPGRLAPPITITPTTPVRLTVIAGRASTIAVSARFTPTGSVVPGAQLTPFVVAGEASGTGGQVDGGVQKLAIRVKGGRNQVTLALVAGQGAATGANTVQVDDLRVSGG